ncbi:MAG: hypothetical protein PHU14_08130 [Methylovulum sp.]|nr:hypothetical protein [Methylovulum sp.]
MKQPDDNRTLTLIPEPKKRGRPATGNARTAAQRKADQRARDMTAAIEEQDLSGVSNSGLLEMLAMGERQGMKQTGDFAHLIWREIGKRRGFIA